MGLRRIFPAFYVSSAPCRTQRAMLSLGIRCGAPWRYQGDIFSASFAAVPHVVEALASAPGRAPATFFHFPAWVEVCRKTRGTALPKDLEFAYFAALARLPSLVAAAVTRPWDDEFTACALGAIAAVKGNVKVAQAVMELTPIQAERFLASLFV